MDKKKYVIDVRFFILKIMIVISFFILVFSIVFYLGGLIVEEDSFTVETQTQICHREYKKGDYARLYASLRTLDVQEDKLDIYVEITDANNDYLRWQTWQCCVRKDYFENADTILAECRQTVYDNYENCRNPENKERLYAFVEQMEAAEEKK